MLLLCIDEMHFSTNVNGKQEMGDQDDFWKVFESAGDCGEGI